MHYDLDTKSQGRQMRTPKRSRLSTRAGFNAWDVQVVAGPFEPVRMRLCTRHGFKTSHVPNFSNAQRVTKSELIHARWVTCRQHIVGRRYSQLLSTIGVVREN